MSVRPNARAASPALTEVRAPVATPALPLRLAILTTEPAMDSALDAARRVLAHAGVALDARPIPESALKGGTVGRIGVPQAVLDAVEGADAVLAPVIGRDPLEPATRLWRGLVRRYAAERDVSAMQTLPGSPAARAGHARDLVLVAQRMRVDGSTTHDDIDGWGRARRTAERVVRMAIADERDILVVTPPGRLGPQAKLLADAVDREARTHRITPPQVIKAGMLAAHIAGRRGVRRAVIVSAMTMAELRATLDNAIGSLGPWPAVSEGADRPFIAVELPATDDVQCVDPTGLLLACSMLLRERGDRAGEMLLHAMQVTVAAEARMRHVPAERLRIPAHQVAAAVIANWGRVLPAAEAHGMPLHDGQGADGLIVRIQTALAPADASEAMQAIVSAHGMQVAAVRAADLVPVLTTPVLDVRMRIGLGEPTLTDARVGALVRAVAAQFRCLLVAPWTPGGAAPAPTVSRSTPPDPRRMPTGRLARRSMAITVSLG
jgi:hypothetical protein